MKRFKVAVIFLSLFLFGFTGKEVSQKDFGEKWPFTISSGRVECRGNKEVVFVSKDKVYALNGKASGSKKYRNLFEVWRENYEFPGSRIPVTDMIQLGLQFCR